MEQSKKQLTLDVIARKNTNYLPSVVRFTNLAKKMECANYVGITDEDEYDRYLGNHVMFTNQLDDIASNENDNDYKLQKALDSGRTKRVPGTDHIVNPWGLEFQIKATSYFNYAHPLAGSMDDPSIVDRFTPPSLDNLDLLFELPMADLEKYGEDIAVILSGYNGIWEKSYDMVNIEEFMLMLVKAPKTAEKIMDMVTDHKVALAKETVRRGFPIGHHGDDLGTQTTTIMSEKMFVKLLKPRIKRIFDVYKSAGVPVQLHSCGCITKFIPHLIEIGLDILEPTQPCMDIEFLKREYGKDLIFYGGIDTQDLLAFRTPKEIREETLRTIDILGKGGGYICAPAQEIMNNVPPENVEALVSAIRETRGE